MRITIVQGAFFPVPALRGGAVEKIWFALGKEFARCGHEVTHVSRLFGGLPREEMIEGVRHVRLGGFDSPKSLLTLKILDLLYSLSVLPLLRSADILVTHTFWLPILIRSTRFGKLYVHVARFPKGQMRFYAHAARLQTVSPPIKAAIVSEVPYREKSVQCIPNPLPEREVDETHAQTDDRQKHLLYVGRVHPEKGLDLLLAALALVPERVLVGWKLLVVGPAESSAGGGGEAYLKGLKERAAAARIPVEWIGPVYDSMELAKYYRSASLFVYPSLADRGETFGLAPLEAMSHGCPALVSNLSCFGDFVQDEITGFVFDHHSPQPERALAIAVERLVGDSARIDRVREAALRKSAEFGLEWVAGLYLQDFKSLSSSETTASV